ncbi:MAG: class III extradiol ring-cleavage dioxygenase [Ectothiorhodospiraceae bacterium]|jgi:4,5-DOPA dioxygenase extradiol
MTLPTLFVSHGAPTLLLDDTPARTFLEGLGRELPRPEAVVVLSAHWETVAPTVAVTASPRTIHDFHGFPAPLYSITYPAPGAPELGRRIAADLVAAGLDAGVDPQWGLDHGAWQVLRLMYPAADIPVLQVSVQPAAGTAHHLALGRALASLRRDGILVMGSGGLTHNLREFGRHGLSDPAPEWVREFADWVDERLHAGDEEALLDYRRRAPGAARNHPTEEHFLPLFAAMGAAGPSWNARRQHSSTTYGVLRMDAYAFS